MPRQVTSYINNNIEKLGLVNVKFDINFKVEACFHVLEIIKFVSNLQMIKNY